MSMESQKKSHEERGLKSPNDSQLKRRFDISEGDRYFSTNELDSPNAFRFEIESIGAIPSIQILYSAIIIIREKIKNHIRV